MAHIDQLFEVLINAGASDLHLAEGQPPKIRRHGDVIPIREELLTADEMNYMLSEICSPKNWERFHEKGDLDFAYEMDADSRFRCNYFKQVHGLGAVFRLIPTRIATLDELGLPPVITLKSIIARSAFVRPVNRSCRGISSKAGSPQKGYARPESPLMNSMPMRTTRKRWSSPCRGSSRNPNFLTGAITTFSFADHLSV